MDCVLLESAGLLKSSVATVRLIVANRLLESLIDWAHRTALPEMFDLRITKTAKDRLCSTSELQLQIESALPDTDALKNRK